MSYDFRKIFYSDEIANSLGISPSILFCNIAFWVTKNEENDINYFDGKYWMYNSAENFAESLPFFTPSKIYSYLNKLIAAGYIMRGNYNKVKYDRTSWYTLTPKGTLLAKGTAQSK